MAKFSIKKRLESFKFAFRGLSILMKSEHNAWIHLCAAITAILMGLHFKISSTEWIAITISIGMVFCGELFNSAIEQIANFIHPERDERIRDIKDLAAGGVLVLAIAAAVVGLIIFIPYCIVST